VTFKLIQRTKLPIVENSRKETRKGQNEVCTAKKGLMNIIEY
jgi:hypothetical protein